MLDTPSALLSTYDTECANSKISRSQKLKIRQKTKLPQKCRERAYRNILRTTMSTLWRMELLHLAPLHLPHNDCRKTSYIHTARDDLHRCDLFKPTQYLRSHLDQLPLLRLRTQVTSHIPSHLHLSNTHTYPPYDQRHCPSCLPIQIVGNEPHTSYTVPTLTTSPILSSLTLPALFVDLISVPGPHTPHSNKLRFSLGPGPLNSFKTRQSMD